MQGNEVKLPDALYINFLDSSLVLMALKALREKFVKGSLNCSESSVKMKHITDQLSWHIEDINWNWKID